MGKSWFYWAGGSGGRRSIEREKCGGGGVERESPPAGCMSSVFQLFDFHLYQFAKLHRRVPSDFKLDSFPPQQPTILKGVEAPRNSLEKEHAFMEAIPFPSTLKENETLSIPMGIQIKTRCETGTSKIIANSESKTNDFSPTTTPNLVARLMGLDLLPENCSPSLSSSCPLKSRNKEFQYRRSNTINGRISFDNTSHSFSETLRLSTGRRSDVDHHRLSLQIGKENNFVREDFEFLVRKKSKKRELGKQENEKVSRKFGKDINNTCMRNREQRRDDALLVKSKMSSKLCPEREVRESRLRPLRAVEAAKNHGAVTPQPTRNQVQKKPSRGLQNKERPSKKLGKIEGKTCKKITRSSTVFRNKREETFDRKSKSNRDKKCKKMPILSSKLMNMNGSTFFPVKTEPLSPTKLPQKQSQESDAVSSKRRTPSPSCLGQKYNPETTSNGSSNDVTTTHDAAQIQYITKLLRYAGIYENTPMSLAILHSPSHPLCPSTFNCLEFSFSDNQGSLLSLRSNRKLLFELVNEILVEILEPYLNFKPSVIYSNIRYDCQMNGSELIDKLFSKIHSFPSANCSVLEDIDELIDDDLSKSEMKTSAFDEEGEAVVAELEQDLVDLIVHEMAVEIMSLKRNYLM